jgi:O-antigen ligase
MLNSRIFYFGLLIFILSWLNYDHYRPWVNFHSETMALASLSMLLVSILVRENDIKAPKPFVLIFVGLVMFVWLQYVCGLVSFSGDATLSTIFIVCLFVAVIVGFSIGNAEDSSETWLMAFMHAIWISAFASAFIGLLQWFNLQESWGMYVSQTYIGDRASGNMGQPNLLATLLLMGLPALSYVQSKHSLSKPMFGAVVVIITLALVMAQSRAALLSAILIAGFGFWKSRLPSSDVSGRWTLVWLGSFLLSTWLLPYATQFLLTDGPRALSVNSSELRLHMWKQIASAIWQSPWVGYGWNQTPTAHTLGALAYPGSFTFTYTHNVVLDILAWCGLPIGLLIVGVSGYWVVSRALKVTENKAVFAMGALLPILMHSMVEYPFAYTYFLLSAGIFIGVVERSAGTMQAMVLRKTYLWIAMTLWIPFAGYLVFEYLLIEEDFRIVRFESLRIGKTPLEYQKPNIIVLSQMGSMLEAGRIYPKPKMRPEELEKLRVVARRFAYSAVNNRYMVSLALNGEMEKARRELTIIRSMYGEYYYQAAVQELKTLKQTKYPELGALVDR